MFQTACKVNYDNWPWGEQNCTFTAGSWTYDMDNIDLQPYIDGIDYKTPITFEHFENDLVRN